MSTPSMPSTPSTSSTPSRATHHERLWPAAWVWVVCPLLASCAGLVVIVALGAVVAAVTALVAVVAAGVGLITSSAVVEVRDRDLQAGRAQIPVALLGRVRVVDAERMSALRGREANARAYLCQRGWIPRGVLVEILDPADPVPYWLVSSRRPERLAAALEGARGEPSSDPGGRPAGPDPQGPVRSA